MDGSGCEVNAKKVEMMKKQTSIFVHLTGITESIEADLMLPLRAHEQADRGGFFSITRQVFSYIDYLGALAGDGQNTTKSAVAYMEKYFSLANPAYTGTCCLLFFMWRHGTVHEYDPKVVVSHVHGFHLRWGANNTSEAENRKWHLKCLCRASEPNTYHWFINLFELVDDLKKSVNHFVIELKSNQMQLERAEQNLSKLSAEVDLDARQNPPFSADAKAVVGVAAGVIDDRGHVIRTFTNPADFEKFKSESWTQQTLNSKSPEDGSAN